MNTALKRFLFIPLACLLWPAPQALAASVASIPEDSHAGVILAYSRIGEDTDAENDIDADQFLSHVEEITRGGYNVMALPAFIDALKNKEDVPDQTIVITFDGAYKSALQNALPDLLKKNIPFTVFFASDEADNPGTQYMSWDDLKELARHKNVTLGLLPANYARLTAEQDIRTSINKAKQRYRDMIGGEPVFFSYPFGEYSLAYKKIIEESGFTAAFGLQSGVAAESSDFYALPRFTMTQKYGDADRFETVVEALPFPTLDVEPPDTYLKGDPPVIGFSVPPSLKPGLKSISCFISGEAKTNVQIVDNRVELRPVQPITDERARVNCTMPGPKDPDDDTQLYRWFGMLLVNPAAPPAQANDAVNQQPGGLQ